LSGAPPTAPRSPAAGPNPSLIDGLYRLTVPSAARFTNPRGTLDPHNNGTPGGDNSFNLQPASWRRPTATPSDVTSPTFSAFLQNAVFARPTVAAQAAFDFEGDGDVDPLWTTCSLLRPRLVHNRLT